MGNAWALPGAARELTPADRARRDLATRENRPPTDGDAPPLSTLPMTAAAREALRMDRSKQLAAPRAPVRASEPAGVRP